MKIFSHHLRERNLKKVIKSDRLRSDLPGVGELRYDEAQTRSPTTKMIFLILSRNRNISKSKNSELIIELNALTFVQMQE